MWDNTTVQWRNVRHGGQTRRRMSFIPKQDFSVSLRTSLISGLYKSRLRSEVEPNIWTLVNVRTPRRRMLHKLLRDVPTWDRPQRAATCDLTDAQPRSSSTLLCTMYYVLCTLTAGEDVQSARETDDCREAPVGSLGLVLFRRFRTFCRFHFSCLL